ncbi:hypothetical protein B0H16DRAFT_1717464 [Mycena metata]|uniref:F-box domain-containing protein n=1 Tax=Mycena metata TaxID=1033252 RepID=A0AAD7JNN8_9AGAR|nr:hypothetical protein B0H16DRAFT_1717464 [Mycena metata]
MTRIASVVPLTQSGIMPLIAVDGAHAAPATAPVYRVPVELLEEIFTLCRPKVLGHWERSKINLERLAQTHLIDLVQVCSRWNIVVKGTPSLWCTIELYISPPQGPMTPTSIGTIMHLLRLSLERSRNFPLDLHIYADGHGGSVIDLVA